MVKFRFLCISFFFFVFMLNYAEGLELKGRILFDNDSCSIAQVQLVSIPSGSKETTLSNPANGSFIFKSLKAGEHYKLFCSSMGYLADTVSIPKLMQNTDIGDIKLISDVKALKEVIVTANMVEAFASKDKIIIPSSIKKYASSGYEAISQLPQFSENIINNTLMTLDRKSVKILLNGIESSERELLSILASDILRVEYFTNPPARYANLNFGAVLNVITVNNRISGSDYFINTKNSVVTGYGTNIASAKFYNKNNVFDISYFVDYRRLNKNRINQFFKYQICDTNYINNYWGENGLYKGEYHSAQMKYLNLQKDGSVFSSKFNYSFNPGKQKNIQKSYVSYDDQLFDEGLTYKNVKSGYNAYSTDIYYNKKLKNDQSLLLNLVGTYYDSYSDNSLRREMSNNTDNFYYNNNVRNISWSVIGELMYEKKIKDHMLVSGFRFYEKLLNQDNNEDLNSEVNQQLYYLYAGLNGHLSKIKYSFDIGGEANSNKMNGIENLRTTFFTIKPSLSASYNLTKQSFLRFTGKVHSIVPEASMLTLSPVYLNYRYMSIGNSSLKPYYLLQNVLQYQMNSTNLYLSTSVKYNYSFNPFMPAFAEYEDIIIKTMQYKSRSYFAGYDLSLRWSPWNWLAIQPYFSVAYTEVKNKDGSSFADFTKLASLTVSLMYKMFKLTMQGRSSYNNLDGDILEKRGAYFSGELSYVNKRFNAGIQYVHNPTPTTISSKSKIIDLHEKTIWGNFNNLIVLKASYSFSVGKKNNIKFNQRISNTDSDSGLREDAKAK